MGLSTLVMPPLAARCPRVLAARMPDSLGYANPHRYCLRIPPPCFTPLSLRSHWGLSHWAGPSGPVTPPRIRFASFSVLQAGKGTTASRAWARVNLGSRDGSLILRRLLSVTCCCPGAGGGRPRVQIAPVRSPEGARAAGFQLRAAPGPVAARGHVCGGHGHALKWGLFVRAEHGGAYATLVGAAKELCQVNQQQPITELVLRI